MGIWCFTEDWMTSLQKPSEQDRLLNAVRYVAPRTAEIISVLCDWAMGFVIQSDISAVTSPAGWCYQKILVILQTKAAFIRVAVSAGIHSRDESYLIPFHFTAAEAWRIQCATCQRRIGLKSIHGLFDLSRCCAFRNHARSESWKVR